MVGGKAGVHWAGRGGGSTERKVARRNLYVKMLSLRSSAEVDCALRVGLRKGGNERKPNGRKLQFKSGPALLSGRGIPMAFRMPLISSFRQHLVQSIKNVLFHVSN